MSGSFLFLKITSTFLFWVKSAQVDAWGRRRQSIFGKRWCKHEVIIKASRLLWLPGLPFHPIRLKHRIKKKLHPWHVNEHALLQNYNSSYICHLPTLCRCWEGEGVESKAKKKTDVCGEQKTKRNWATKSFQRPTDPPPPPLLPIRSWKSDDKLSLQSYPRLTARHRTVAALALTESLSSSLFLIVLDATVSLGVSASL